jgi:hypothetical protein
LYQAPQFVLSKADVTAVIPSSGNELKRPEQAHVYEPGETFRHYRFDSASLRYLFLVLF